MRTLICWVLRHIRTIMRMCLAPCFFVQISVLGYIKQLCKSKRCISENLLRPQHVRFDSFSKKKPMNNNWQMQKFLSSGRGYLLKASFCGVGRAPRSQTCLLHSYLISYAYLNSLYLMSAKIYRKWILTFLHSPLVLSVL